MQALRDKVAELGAENVAAFFCEPIQGSGGVIVPPVGWLKAMRETARELDILFLADEVITGFGRTGPMFACAAEGVTPDIMTVAKGLTAGYVPMGAVLLSEQVYAGIADGAAPKSWSGTATPIRPSGHAAVALESFASMKAAFSRMGRRLAHNSRPVSRASRAIRLWARRGRAVCLRPRACFRARHAKPPSRQSSNCPSGCLRAVTRTAFCFVPLADGTIGLAPALSCTAEEMDELLRRLEKTLNDVSPRPKCVRRSIERQIRPIRPFSSRFVRFSRSSLQPAGARSGQEHIMLPRCGFGMDDCASRPNRTFHLAIDA